MSAYDEYDLKEQKHRHSLEMEDKRNAAARRLYRIEAVKWASVAFASASAVLGITYAIYLGTTGPDVGAEQRHEIRVTCVKEGGTVVEQFDSGGYRMEPLCVFSKDES